MMSLRLLLREIIRPSDRGKVKPFRRVIRRSAIVVLTLPALLAIGIWVVSYTGPYFYYKIPFGQCNPPVYPFGGHGHITVSYCFGDGASGPAMGVIGANEGRAGVTYVASIAKGAILPIRAIELAGFRWTQSGGNSGVRWTWVGFPCWAPVLLFSTWPIIAFIRGPYRRARQRAKGFCHKCGYNLTGLVEPRCPECGTAMSPDQVNRRMSVSV